VGDEDQGADSCGCQANSGDDAHGFLHEHSPFPTDPFRAMEKGQMCLLISGERGFRCLIMYTTCSGR
jgi:hypothetical protein